MFFHPPRCFNHIVIISYLNDTVRSVKFSLTIILSDFVIFGLTDVLNRLPREDCIGHEKISSSSRVLNFHRHMHLIIDIYTCFMLLADNILILVNRTSVSCITDGKIFYAIYLIIISRETGLILLDSPIQLTIILNTRQHSVNANTQFTCKYAGDFSISSLDFF